MTMTARRPLRRPPVSAALTTRTGIQARWGSVSVTPEHIARMQGSLTAAIHVYPPGMTTTARRLVHLRQLVNSWSGVIMGTLILAAGTALGGWWPGTALALALLAVGYVALMLGTRRDAARVRIVRVHAHRGGMSDTSLFEVVGAQLDALDGADLSPVEYEAEWWRIYEALDRPIGE